MFDNLYKFKDLGIQKVLIAIVICASIVNLMFVFSTINSVLVGYVIFSSETAHYVVSAIVAAIITIIIPFLMFLSGYFYAIYKHIRDTGRLCLAVFLFIMDILLVSTFSVYSIMADNKIVTNFGLLILSCVLILVMLLTCCCAFIVGVNKACFTRNIVIGKYSDEKYSAYPGDTYVYDAISAYNSTPKWLYAGVIAIIAAVIVDFANLQDLIAQVLNTGSDDPLPKLVAGSITVAYLILGIYVGNSLRHYLFCLKADKKRLFVEIIIGMSLIILFIIIVSIFRYMFEDMNFTAYLWTLPDDKPIDRMEPFANTLIYTVMMLMGAFVALFYGYKKHNPVSEEIMNDAKASIANDRTTYREVFQKYIIENFNEKEWESQLRKIDSEYFKKTTELANISLKLSMIHDPSQAEDIAMMTKRINDAILGRHGKSSQVKVEG